MLYLGIFMAITATEKPDPAFVINFYSGHWPAGERNMAQFGTEHTQTNPFNYTTHVLNRLSSLKILYFSHKFVFEDETKTIPKALPGYPINKVRVLAFTAFNNSNSSRGNYDHRE
jgi:hypothetical protein